MKRKNIEIFRDAVNFANSGKCANWKEVETELVDKGHRRAPDLLDSTKIRMILDAQCKLSQKST